MCDARNDGVPSVLSVSGTPRAGSHARTPAAMQSATQTPMQNANAISRNQYKSETEEELDFETEAETEKAE